MLSNVVDLIILIGALCGAIYKIWDFFAKPTSKLKKRSQEKEAARIKAILNEELPDKLYQHDLEVRERYRADRERYLLEIKDEVIKAFGEDIQRNNLDMESLKISAKDVLREKIMAIYHKNKNDRTISEHEHEALEQYYKDYKALGGNSYIDKYYRRMSKWVVQYDDLIEEEE